MSDDMNSDNIRIPRATGLLVIEVMNSNPNGDPDQESDPRRRSHDQRGMITGVSFKRKLRDLVLQKDEPVWQTVGPALGIRQDKNGWQCHGMEFEILESRDHTHKEIEDDYLKQKTLESFKKCFWDARVFGNTFLEKQEKGKLDPVRSGVAHFGLGVSVSPVRIHRMTKTKMAPAQGGNDDSKGPSRGMAPLAHRVVEHGVYTMPFFVNPTGAQGQRGTGCTSLDIRLLLQLIRYAYPHTKSDIRPLVEVRYAWYAEHEDGLGSFSEFEFIEAMTPKRKGDSEQPSISGIPLNEQYEVPASLPEGFRGTLKNNQLLDLCVEFPDWCAALKSN